MKLIYSNGKVLKVYEINEQPLLIIQMRDIPIKINGYQIIDDDSAREKLKDLLRTGLYDKVTTARIL